MDHLKTTHYDNIDEAIEAADAAMREVKRIARERGVAHPLEIADYSGHGQPALESQLERASQDKARVSFTYKGLLRAGAAANIKHTRAGVVLFVMNDSGRDEDFRSFHVDQMRDVWVDRPVETIEDMPTTLPEPTPQRELSRNQNVVNAVIEALGIDPDDFRPYVLLRADRAVGEVLS